MKEQKYLEDYIGEKVAEPLKIKNRKLYRGIGTLILCAVAVIVFAAISFFFYDKGKTGVIVVDQTLNFTHSDFIADEITCQPGGSIQITTNDITNTGTEDGYVFLVITTPVVKGNNLFSVEDVDTNFWTLYKSGSGYYVYAYNDAVGSDDMLEELSDELTMADISMSSYKELGGEKVIMELYAADTSEGMDKAWSAICDEYGLEFE